jgi:hypothetical protein
MFPIDNLNNQELAQTGTRTLIPNISVKKGKKVEKKKRSTDVSKKRYTMHNY